MADPRFKYVQERIEQGLKGWEFTPSVEALLSQGKNRQILEDFMKPSGPEKMMICCQRSSNGKNKLNLTTGQDENLNGKCCYFTRVNPKGIDVKSFELDCAYGEIVGNPLSNFNVVVQDVFRPAIESEESFGKCPEENWKEYSGTVSKFAEMLTEAVHSLKGGIELPMPDSKYETIQPTQPAFAKAAVDSDVVTHFENIVEKWCSQIEDLLDEKQPPSKDADDSGPETGKIVQADGLYKRDI
eukprot:767109-Hanusia_phi.AAC.2